MITSRQVILASAAGLLSGALAGAQSPATSVPGAAQPSPVAREPVRLTESTDPASLPGDFMDIPQTAQLKVPLGTPAVTHNTRPLPTDATPSPGYALALEAAQVAMESCESDGYRVAVAVTDAAGKLKVALAPDGVANNRVYMALRKDVTVVGFRMPTLALRAKIEADASLMAQVKPNMVLLPGGMPIMKGEVLVGAIAASGATAYVEEKCARAGIEKIQSRL
jgi:uncharacterized protein GlcG (DUF336 family)